MLVFALNEIYLIKMNMFKCTFLLNNFNSADREQIVFYTIQIHLIWLLLFFYFVTALFAVLLCTFDKYPFLDIINGLLQSQRWKSTFQLMSLSLHTLYNSEILCNPNDYCPRAFQRKSGDIVCLFVLKFYGPVNPIGSCQAWSVYLTTRLLGRLSPLNG